MKEVYLSEGRSTDSVCRSFYIRLTDTTRKYGLDKKKIEQTRTTLTDYHEGNALLKPEAYKPTGIALGHPLPDPRIQSRLYRVSLTINHYIQKSLGTQKPAFAFVPPASYHITLLNWSHYSVSGLITALGKKEIDDIKRHLSGEWKESPVILINGLILTRAGAILVPGFPASDLFYSLRTRLNNMVRDFETYPVPSPPLPPAAHIKLGHLLYTLDREKLGEFMYWLSLWGNHISGRLSFEDLYTRAGRIPLS